MSTRHRLEKLLQNPRIWKAGAGGPRRRFLPTGFIELDAALAGGWPTGQLIELLVDPCGIGELRLLMPALAGRIGTRADQWLLFIAPPYIPYAPAFAYQGLSMSRLLVVHCRHQADVLWAAEQALQSRACAAVLAWTDAADERALRRLQLAAEADGACLFVMFRPPRLRSQRSPAALRIELQPGAAGPMNLLVFKNRGGRPQIVTIDVGGE